MTTDFSAGDWTKFPAYWLELNNTAKHSIQTHDSKSRWKQYKTIIGHHEGEIGLFSMVL